MVLFILRRLGQALIAIFGVMTLVFFIQRLTGDPTYLLVPETATQADIEAMRRSLGLDQPIIVQYMSFLRDIAQFDFGRSYVQRIPVTTIIASRLPYTLQLAGGALLVSFGLGVPLGVVMALWRDRPATKLLTGFVFASQSMPTFWSGILFILFFAVWLGWLPPSGAGGIENLILPSFALGLLSMATFARVTRTAMLDELSKDYVRSARARGVATPRLFWRHLARNAAIPVISVAALEISQLLAGAVIVETVFAWPGLGLLTVQSIVSRDFLVVQGIVLIGAFVTIALNFTADILYSVVDPRIRLDGSRP
ncbi:ABC transporter permease [Lutibaculum baratangense]|uniref:Dipeptide transport system permease protein DppB n=1 Tax=Lutibaculum baratangense AMV1 TaxID=631454 RepID=V4RC69_9HYPH|nr:ABC transporter permease [Lutibaculum baratangense]ESR23766.1 Dipeptide transport system permease protein DppB [Lutibaculum baratangense AMV1]